MDLNATQAAIRAGYSVKTAASIGEENLRKPEIATAIQAAQQARSDRTQITADMVLERWWDLANADANELIEHRRACCRYCYGTEHRYQRTPGEMARDRAAHAALAAQATEKQPVGPFDEMGGDGYNGRQPPHPECPECFGEGVGVVFMKDSRNASPAARRLYAGVKQSKDGFEVKLRDQDGALANVAKHLGMFTEKVEHSGAVDIGEKYAAFDTEALKARARTLLGLK